MTSTSPMTELDAVNTMLEEIGEAPVNSLTGAITSDVILAKSTLSQVSRAVQSFGWNFNTETDYTLTPDLSTGELKLPLNCLRVDADRYYPSVDFVQRGSRIYDRKNQTYTFTQSYKVDMLILLPFEELPEAAKYFITQKASKRFQKKIVGSDTLDKLSEEELQEARLLFHDADSDTADYNIFNNYDAARPLMRRPYNGSIG